MSDMMRYRGKRALVTGLSLEPGHVYKIDPLERKYGREGFWVEITMASRAALVPTTMPMRFSLVGKWPSLP